MKELEAQGRQMRGEDAMTSEQMIEARLERGAARREAAARKPDDAATPQQKLVRAAESGRFETRGGGAAGRTAEDGDAGGARGRAARQRPTALFHLPRPTGEAGRGRAQDVPVASPHLDPPPSDGGGGPELTPNEQYIAEHCQWRRRGPIGLSASVSPTAAPRPSTTR